MLPILEVGCGKLTKQGHCHQVVSHSRLVRRIKPPKAAPLTFEVEPCAPPIAYATHALVWLSAPSVPTAVSGIAGSIRQAKIAPSVVQPITIDVINLKPWRRAGDDPMHEDRAAALTPHRVPTVAHTPSQTIEVCVLAVHESMCDDRAIPTAEWNPKRIWLQVGFASVRSSRRGLPFNGQSPF